MNVKIITDSASDLPKDMIDELGIDVVPLLVYLGEEEYLDSITLDSITLFRNMREGKVYKTSQASYQSLRDVFVRCAEAKQPAFYVAFSSELSGTYSAAVMVKHEVLEEYPDLQLEILDTRCASGGHGLVVREAALMAQAGQSLAEIVEATKYNAMHMEHIFTVDDLEYLYRGGRVSKTAAFIGGLLNIKPLLNVEDGKLIPIEKIRGWKKVLTRMVEVMAERGAKDLSNQVIGIFHGDDLEAAEQLKALIEERFGCKHFIITPIGCAVGAHSGPGTLALFFLNAPHIN